MFRACITLVASLDSGKIWFEKSSQSMVWWNDCFGWQISTDGIGQFFAHWDLPGCLLWRNLDMVSWSPNMSDDRLRCILDHISHDQGDCVAWKQKSQDSLCIVLGWAILCWAVGCPTIHIFFELSYVLLTSHAIGLEEATKKYGRFQWGNGPIFNIM